MKSEFKVEIGEDELLEKLIKKSYPNGRLVGSKNFIPIDSNNKEVFEMLNDLNNATIKVTNHNLIDGVCRFLVHSEKNTIKIYPISTYCIKDNKKFIFH